MPALEYIPHDALTILTRLITTAIDRGYVISVHDGLEWATKKSTDRRAILETINSVEDCTLLLRGKGDSRHAGKIIIIPSNCADVLSDWTDTPEMNALIEPLL